MERSIFSQSDVDRLAGETGRSKWHIVGMAAMIDTRADESFEETFGRIIAAVDSGRLHLYYDTFSAPCGYFVVDRGERDGSLEASGLLYLLDFQAKPGWLRLLARATLSLSHARNCRIVCPAGYIALEAVELVRFPNNRIRIVAFEQSDEPLLDISASSDAGYYLGSNRYDGTSLSYRAKARRLRDRAEGIGIILDHLLRVRRFPEATLQEVRRFALGIWRMGQFWISKHDERGVMILWGWLSRENLSASRVRDCHQFHLSELNEGQNLCLLSTSIGERFGSADTFQQWAEAVAAGESIVFYLDGMRPAGLPFSQQGQTNLIPLAQ